jgi:hypothetical protein
MSPRSLLERVTQGVPDISAEAAGAFRVCFGLGLLGVMLPLGFGTDPRVKLATITALALFTIGIWARQAYAISVLGITLYAIAQKQGHNWSMPLLTLWCLLPARWGDGLSLDAAIRRWRRGSAGPWLRGQEYGFAIWLPGLTFGSALAAAAFAKLQRSGLDWVTTGAVRFHFVEDSFLAPVNWGLWVAAHYPVAVLLSFGALAIEAVFILNIFFPGPWIRAAFGLFGVAIFGGFYVFQGVFWRPWWIILMAFLPWGLIGRHHTRELQTQPFRLGLARALVIVIVVVQQVIASAGQIEIEPFISWYPMYIHTYGSLAKFEEAKRYNFRYWRYYFEIDTPGGVVDVSDRIRAISGAERAIHSTVADLEGRSGPLSEELSQQIGAIRSIYEARYGTALQMLRLSYDRRAFDWEHGNFYWAVKRGDAGVLDFDAPALVQPQNSNNPMRPRAPVGTAVTH